MKILMRTTMDIRYTFFSYLNNGKHMLIQLLKKKNDLPAAVDFINSTM